MKRVLIMALTVATAMLVLSCISRNRNARNAKTSGPGDPKLTYDLVIQNVDSYKGKRVRWYGRQISFESTGKPGSREYIIRATFADMGNWQAGGDMQPFVVEYGSKKEYSEMPREGWVTGTIKGTHTVGITIGSPSGRETTTPRSVPLLSYPKIEKGDSQHK